MRPIKTSKFKNSTSRSNARYDNQDIFPADTNQSSGNLFSTKNNTNSLSAERKPQTAIGSSRKNKDKPQELIIHPIKPEHDHIIDFISLIISKSVNIGEFHLIHNKNQKNYENRSVKKELSFISEEPEFMGRFHSNGTLGWFLLSNSFGRVYFIDIQSNLTMIDTDTAVKKQKSAHETSSVNSVIKPGQWMSSNLSKKSLSLLNIFERHSKLISAEILERENLLDVKLLLLYENFNFCYFNLHKDDGLSLCKRSLNMLANCKSRYFNFLPYLDQRTRSMSMNSIFTGKVIVKPFYIDTSFQDNIILNFTSCSDRILVFNLKAYTVIHNIKVNALEYTHIELSNGDLYTGALNFFIDAILSKSWSVKQCEAFQSMINDIIHKNSHSMKNYKVLATLIMHEGTDLSADLRTQLGTNAKLSKKVNEMYQCITTLLGFTFEELTKNKPSLKSYTTANFFTLLQVFNDMFTKLKIYSYVFSTGNLTEISKSEFHLYETFLIKCYKRGIDIENVIRRQDKERKGYLSYDMIYNLIKTLPLGMTEGEIMEMLSSWNNFLFDEWNNYLYEQLFEMEEFLLIKLVYERRQNVIGVDKNMYGVFKKVEKPHTNFKIVNYTVKRKYSFDREFNRLECEEEVKTDSIKKHKASRSTVKPRLHQMIIDKCLAGKNHISNIVYVSHLNVFFTLSNGINDSRIGIFSIPAEVSHSSAIKTIPKYIGTIETRSATNPRFIDYIPDRNILISQTLREESNTVDLVLVDIYKDLLDIFQSHELCKVKLHHSRNLVPQAFANELIQDFSYLPRCKVFYIRCNNHIKLINPKAKLNDLAIRYQVRSQGGNVFTTLCKNICEIPAERTGDPPFKVIKDIYLPHGNSHDSLIFSSSILSIDKQCAKASVVETDWIVFFRVNQNINKSKETIDIFSYRVNSIHISLPVKSVDNPIPQRDYEKLLILCERESKKTLDLHKAKFRYELKEKKRIHNTADDIIMREIFPKLKDSVIHNKEIKLEKEKKKDEKTKGKKDKDKAEEEEKSPVKKVIPPPPTIFTHNPTVYDWIVLLKKLSLYFENGKMIAMAPVWKFPQTIYSKNPSVRSIEGKNQLGCFFLSLNANLTSNESTISNTYYLNDTSKAFPLISQFIKSFVSAPNETEMSMSSRPTSIRTQFDSAMKKLAKFIFDRQIKLSKIFSMFDVNEEGIIDKFQFIDGLNQLGLLSSNFLHMGEAEAVFEAMDSNATDCVTEEEFNNFFEMSNLRAYLLEIKKDVSDRLRSDMIKINPETAVKTVTEGKSVKIIEEITEKIRLFHNKYKANDYNEGKIALEKRIFKLMEMFFLDVDMIYKYFDPNNYGMILIKDFVKCIEALKLDMSVKEMEAVFALMDKNERRFYILEKEFKAMLESARKAASNAIQANPNISKSYNSGMVNLNTPIKPQKLESKFTPVIEDFEYWVIISSVFKRLFKHAAIRTNHQRSQSKFSSPTSVNCDEFVETLFIPFSSTDHIPTESLKRKLNGILSLNKLETLLFFESYLDIYRYGILFQDELKRKFEAIFSAMSSFEDLSKSKNNLKDSFRSNKDTYRETLESEKKNESIIQPLPLPLARPAAISNKDVYLYSTLEMIQEKFSSTGLSPDAVYYLLDRDKRGFLTLSTIVERLPLKFNINLTIDQLMLFFEYLDKDKDGLVVYADLDAFFKAIFSHLVFEDISIDVKNLMSKVKDSFTKLFRMCPQVSIEMVYSYFDSSAKGYLLLDEFIYILMTLCGTKLTPRDCRQLLKLLINVNDATHVSFREFIFLLEMSGVDTMKAMDYSRILEIVDYSMVNIIISLQSKVDTMDVVSIFKFFQQFDINKDGFISPKELMKALRCLMPGYHHTDYLEALVTSLVARYCRYTYQDNLAVVPISFLSMVIFYQMRIFNQTRISHTQIQLLPKINQEQILVNSIVPFTSLKAIGSEIEYLTGDYFALVSKGIFSGMIIFAKEFDCNGLLHSMKMKNSKIRDYISSYMKSGNEILLRSFKGRICVPSSKTAQQRKEKKHEVNFSEILIPFINVNIVDTNEILNRRLFSSKLIENFDYYHPELQQVVNVTKFRKSFLLTQTSAGDGQNLLNHVEYSVKLNHYMQEIYDGNETFPLIRNIGIFSREVVIDKKQEEEVYIIDEKLPKDFVSLKYLIESNGGLLQIPELANTDMAFYIIRYWSHEILRIISTLHRINVCCKYLTLDDIFISHDGKEIKFRSIPHFSFADLSGKVIAGPDLLKIFLLYDKLFNSTEVTPEQLTNLYDDSFIPPEFLLTDTKCLTDKTDSWIFGSIIFSLLFGHPPQSFSYQMKKWCAEQTNLIYDKVVTKFPNDILSQSFFYNPYANEPSLCPNIESFAQVLKLKSYSAAVDEKHLNRSMENKAKLNGIGVILDMVNSCLCVDPSNRPDVMDLFSSDLFDIDGYEMILVNKFLINCMNYYSPDLIIIENILFPLRKICAEVMKANEDTCTVINQYENFIISAIKDLNKYLFSREYLTSEDDESRQVDLSEDNKESGAMFVKNPEYNFKNSMIIKAIVENKIIDILIFLVLRHFSANLQIFKSTYEKKYKEIFKVNAGNLDRKAEAEIRRQRYVYIKEEMSRYCGRLIIALCDLLSNCVTAMSSYEHMLSIYVENIIVDIVKLFIGEEYELLSNIAESAASGNTVKKYIHLRTFFRTESIVNAAGFKEDEADRTYSILNSNVELYEKKSQWSPELFTFTSGLFREAFGENGTGSFKYPVIKNYFTAMNEYARNISNILENPFINNDISKYIQITASNNNSIAPMNNFLFVNSEYVAEILSLNETAVNLMASTSQTEDGDAYKNLSNKKSALGYINSIFRNKNCNKIRACLDFKVHNFIEKFLFSNSYDAMIKNEVLMFLKEISMSMVDYDEICWMFGSNYSKIFNDSIKSKTEGVEMNELSEFPSWDSNFSLIHFLNKLLAQPHTFFLYFTDRFLGMNLNTSQATKTINLFMRQFGEIFANQMYLKPIMRILQRSNETISSRSLCLEILFNLMLSNSPKIISNLNSTLCNFYEILIKIVHANLTVVPYLAQESDDSGNDAIANAAALFKKNLKNVVSILTEIQNPYIRTQMFGSSLMVKYLEENNLFFSPRLEFEEIAVEFHKIPELVNFNTFEERIIFLINSFKCWMLHSYSECRSSTNTSYRQEIGYIISKLVHILNIEWREGLKQLNKNCVIFNIIKLFEWLCKKHFHELLFRRDDEAVTIQIMLNLLTKVRETNVTMSMLTTSIDEMTSSGPVSKVRQRDISKNKNKGQGVNDKILGGNKYLTLQKIYNILSIKIMNIISHIFSINDAFFYNILTKLKFGAILADLYKIQYSILNDVLAGNKNDICILNNYIHENRLRLELFETLLKLPQVYDDLKLQFLQSDFILFIFTNLINDFRKFSTEHKKISIEFMAFKDSFPMRMEALSFFNLILKYTSPNSSSFVKTTVNEYLHDELIRNVKAYHFIQNELAIIKNSMKGPKVISVFLLFNIVICNQNKDMLGMMGEENVSEYIKYAVQKDSQIKKIFPELMKYIMMSGGERDKYFFN